MNSPKGLLLLAAAAVLAAGAIGYRAYNAETADIGPLAEEAGPPTLGQLRERADATPDDPANWQLLGFALFERGEFSEAVDAYAKAVSLDDREAALWSALGEARVMASARDPLPEQALAAFRKAISLDPRDPRARYFLAVEKDLAEDHDGAIADWLALLADTPPGAPWEADLIRTIEQVGKINGIDTATRIAAAVDGRLPAAAMAAPATRGPTAQQIAEAGAIPPSEQRDMALGMVERLEQRLADDPLNVEGWVMLMRSRMTLGEPQSARQALGDAIAANPAAETRLRSEAAALGIR